MQENMRCKNILWLSMSFIVIVLLAACSSPGSAPVGQYDFQYQVAGDAATRPYQVFDDGQHTYFQFRDIPKEVKVSVVTPSGLITLENQTSTNYVRARTVASAWQLSDNGKTYTITYTGQKRDDHIKSTEING